MAKRRKTLNAGLAVFCGVVFLLLGLLLGAAGKIFLFPDASYVIPEAIVANSSISAGDIDVDLIKNEDLSIHFVELGNKYTGDCTFIKCGNVEVLIDAGSRTSSIEPIHDYVTQYISDGELEYVIVTHAHRDHYAAFATNESLFDALNESSIEIGEVITFSKTNQKDTSGLYKEFKEELTELIYENGTIISDVLDYCNESGAIQTISLSATCEIEFLYHKYYEEKASTENNYSVSCIINQGSGDDSKHYLFTGDLEADGESSLVDHNPDLPEVELYKAGHHGSKTSSSLKLLNIVKPKIVCVCACAGSPEYTSTNANQFPTQQFIDRIAKFTDAVYVTTLCIDYDKAQYQSMNGNIVVTASAGKATSVYCAASSSKLKDTEWFKTNRTCPAEWAA